MAVSLSFASITPYLKSRERCTIFPPNYGYKPSRIRCNGQKPTSNSSSTSQESEPENALLKIAWYGPELLGIAASFIRSQPNTEANQNDLKLATDGSGAIDRSIVVESIKEDFETSYFVTGPKDGTKFSYTENLEDKGVGYWHFSCIMSFPWRPILSATGYTEYYFDVQSGKVSRPVDSGTFPR